METIRCVKCSKKLAEAEYAMLSIKCPRCGAINIYKTTSHSSERHERLRSSDVKGISHRNASPIHPGE